MKHSEKLIVLTIQSYEKAHKIQSLLMNEGVETVLQNTAAIEPFMPYGVKVRVKAKDKDRAMEILQTQGGDILNGESDKAENNGNRILVPVDFSDYSARACHFAFHIARKSNATVTLLHAYFNPFFPGTFPDSDTFGSEVGQEEAMKELQARIQYQSDKFVNQLKNDILLGDIPAVEFKMSIYEGIPEEEISRWAKHYKPQLIIMGTRGKDQKEIDLIGSVTAEVIDTSPVPVFAIPENTNVKTVEDIHRVAFVTNFDQRDLLGFDKLMHLHGFNNAAVSFIWLANKKNMPTDKKMGTIRAYFQEKYPTLEATYGVIDEEMLLKDTDQFIKENGIDVLVLTTHNRNIFARLFNPSIAHKVVFHTDTPLLVIRN